MHVRSELRPALGLEPRGVRGVHGRSKRAGQHGEERL